MRLILSLLIVCALWSEELPATAQRVTGVMAAEILASKQKALRELRKIATDLGRQSDLDGALVVKKLADDLQAEVDASEPNDVLGNPKTKLVIISARFGSDAKWVDITENVRRMVIDNALTTAAGGWGISDPLPHVRKTSIIEYMLSGVRGTVQALDGERIVINPKQSGAP